MPEPGAGPVTPSRRKIVFVYGLTAAGTLVGWPDPVPYLRARGAPLGWARSGGLFARVSSAAVAFIPGLGFSTGRLREVPGHLSGVRRRAGPVSVPPRLPRRRLPDTKVFLACLGPDRHRYGRRFSGNLGLARTGAPGPRVPLGLHPSLLSHHRVRRAHSPAERIDLYIPIVERSDGWLGAGILRRTERLCRGQRAPIRSDMGREGRRGWTATGPGRIH